MALVPSRQFYPTTTTIFFDSFQSSFSRFHGTHIRLFRSKLMPLCNQKLNLCSSSNWIDKWNEPQKHNLPKQPRALLDYQNNEDTSNSRYGNSDSSNGGGGSSTMDKIVEKLKKFGYIDDVNKNERKVERVIEKGSVEDIFYVEEGMLPNPRGGFSKDSPLGVEDVFRGSDGEVRFPWEKKTAALKEERQEGSLRRRESRNSVAELTVPEPELRRLRNLAMRSKHKTKVGGGGVTQEVVEMIHEKWKSSEIVRLKIDGPPALNMRRMHEILERKTGGVVIWRSGTSICLYRGVSYKDPSIQLHKKVFTNRDRIPENNLISPRFDKTRKDPSRLISNKDHANIENTGEDDEDIEPIVEIKYENEVDKLLDGLGPRYTDWPGCDPLPVDADLLPGLVPGYEPPFRILPFGLRSTLGQKEATDLRRLARVLPPHFALGRSRQLQGLAVAMVKLWEKSSIAKISLKRGVQLTTSERMAEDIKRLTGGVLLSRNKDFLVFYRGKNFLSPELTEALLERERLAKTMQDEEEQARLRASASFASSVEVSEQSGIAGTLSETLDADARWYTKLDNRGKKKIMREAEILRHASLVRKLEHKLSFAERKLMRAERALSKVEVFLNPTEPSADPESITDEERFMLRKLGLRMKAFLLLGRRGVFDGTVENMHLHWKYRELVKIILKAKNFEEVKKIALSLEAESGGLLISVDKISKGYAIVVFRGKDYNRPSFIRPKNLLTKRKALARSIELQRREALNKHISNLQTKVEKLRSEIETMDIVKGHGDEELYDKLDSAYSSDNEEAEDEGDEAYLETVDCEIDGELEKNDSTQNVLRETDIPYDTEYLESEVESEVPESNVYSR